MIVHIERDEWWPIFFPVKEKSTDLRTIEMPDELVERYKKANAEFSKVQKLLRQYYDKLL